jgi:hypothetical protein
MAAGITAHLLSHLIKSHRLRAVYYVLLLALSAAFVIATAVNFAVNESMVQALSSLPLVVLAGVVFLGIAAAFTVRFVYWRQMRAHFKRVETGKSGVNLYS